MHQLFWLRGLNFSPDEGGGGGGGGASGGGDAQEITFTAEQQVKLNQIAADERRRGEAKGKKDAQAEVLTKFGVATLEELEAKLNPQKSKDGKDKDDDALAKRDAEWKPKLDAANQRIAELEAGFKAEKKRASLIDAATKGKAIDPEIVAQLAGDLVDFDESGKLIVKGETGPRLSSNGSPMSPSELIAEILVAKPYLAQASGTQGGGSKENATGSTDPMKKALEDKNAGAFLGAALKQTLGSK